MKNKAFTLIELLVVILIIAVITTIAFPQYQKAIAKAKFAQLQTAYEALIKAQDIHFLANGTYASSLDELDFTPPTHLRHMPCTIGKNGEACTLYGKPNTVALPLASLSRHHEYYGKTLCCAYELTNFILEDTCIQLMRATVKKNSSHSRCYWEQD